MASSSARLKSILDDLLPKVRQYGTAAFDGDRKADCHDSAASTSKYFLPVLTAAKDALSSPNETAAKKGLIDSGNTLLDIFDDVEKATMFFDLIASIDV